MKTIVCFGDSNTWGAVPVTCERYPYEERWTTVLEKALGGNVKVIPEGLNGRTTVFADPVAGDRCGLEHLPMVLESHQPIDLLVMMLGTNDLKDRFNVQSEEIAKASGRLIRLAQTSTAGPEGKAPALLLVCPPPVLPAEVTKGEFLHAPEKSQTLQSHYASIAAVYGVDEFNAGDYIQSSSADGIHWMPEAHREFGIQLAKYIKRILSGLSEQGE
ncbi:MAG: SGNH/GDSL hydrolase family protein [Spirochaetota bacterium]